MDSDRIIKELDQYLSNFWDKGIVQQTQIIIGLLEQNGVPVNNKSDYSSTESILNKYLDTRYEYIEDKENQKQYMDEVGVEEYIDGSLFDTGRISGMLYMLVPDCCIIQYNALELYQLYNLWEKILSLIEPSKTSWKILSDKRFDSSDGEECYQLTLAINDESITFTYHDSYLWLEPFLNDVNHVFQKLKLTDPIYCLTIDEVWLCFMYLPLRIHHVVNYLYQAYTTGEVYDVSSLLGYD
ncbi:hypothetical protein [Zooshikella sp. RANM57]|uniref:hypothetical protein n=1 Tax=Zooshikella sp. RANM57 TaxID=3425863 RepID=UPI003D6ED4A1